jgi:hypothetical protein
MLIKIEDTLGYVSQKNTIDWLKTVLNNGVWDIGNLLAVGFSKWVILGLRGMTPSSNLRGGGGYDGPLATRPRRGGGVLNFLKSSLKCRARMKTGLIKLKSLEGVDWACPFTP